jgi:hypothetical protein
VKTLLIGFDSSKTKSIALFPPCDLVFSTAAAGEYTSFDNLSQIGNKIGEVIDREDQRFSVLLVCSGIN